MIVYSNGCPKCKSVKSILKTKGTKYKEVSDMVEIIRVATEMGTQELPLITEAGENGNERYSGSAAVAFARGL